MTGKTMKYVAYSSITGKEIFRASTKKAAIERGMKNIPCHIDDIDGNPVAGIADVTLTVVSQVNPKKRTLYHRGIFYGDIKRW